jgi:EF hand
VPLPLTLLLLVLAAIINLHCYNSYTEPPLLHTNAAAVHYRYYCVKLLLSTSVEWDAVSATARDFICSLLKREPSQRLTAPQALQHPWFAAAAALQKQALQGSSDSPAGTTAAAASGAAAGGTAAGAGAGAGATSTGNGELTMARINVRLRRFVGMNKLKKVALNVIAQQLTEAQIGHLRTMFEALDADGNGVISVQELQQVCVTRLDFIEVLTLHAWF